MLSIFRIAAVLLLLTGTAAQSQIPSADTGSYEHLHKVAILSAIGDRFETFHEVSYTEMQAGTLDIAGWHVDDAVQALLRKYLGGRFEFVDMPFDRAAVRALPQHFMVEGNTLSWIRTLTNPGVDAYILVRPSVDLVPGAYGLGMIRRRGSGTLVWANFEIDIIDAHSIRYIGKAHSRLLDKEGGDPHIAALVEDPAFWPGGMLPLSPGQMEWLRRQMQEMLPRALVETLRALKLGVKLPPPLDHSIAPPATAGGVTGIHTVAVVSAIGDVFSLNRASNVFEKALDVTVPIGDWGVDDTAEKLAADILSRRFKVVPSGLDRAALYGFEPETGSRPVLPPLPANTAIDAYVVIVKVRMRGTQQAGLGLFCISWMGKMVDSYADYAVLLVDAHTLAVRKAVFASMDAKAGGGDPRRDVDGSFWPSTTDSLPPDLATRLHGEMLSLITGSLPETLYRMDLGDEATPKPDAALP